MSRKGSFEMDVALESVGVLYSLDTLVVNTTTGALAPLLRILRVRLEANNNEIP